jgi:hypothetical protein
LNAKNNFTCELSTQEVVTYAVKQCLKLDKLHILR